MNYQTINKHMNWTNEQLAEWQNAIISQDMGKVLNAIAAIARTGDKSLLCLLQNAGSGLRASFKMMKNIHLNEDDPSLNFDEFRDHYIKQLTASNQLTTSQSIVVPVSKQSQSSTRKIFISYNHHDQVCATKLALELKQQPDVDVFIDHWDMSAGESLLDRIEKAIDESSFLIVLLSSNSVESKWVETELQYAFLKQQEQRMRIIPVIIDECKLPSQVAGSLCIDMKPTSDRERSMQYLVNAIRGHKPFSKLVSEYINSATDASPYEEKAKREGRRLLLELAKYCEMDVEENQKWMLWEIFRKLLPKYLGTMKVGRSLDWEAPKNSYSFIFVDRWNNTMCSIVLEEEEFRRGLWSGDLDLIRGSRFKAKHLKFLDYIGRLSLDGRCNPHTEVNPFLDSCAPTMKPILQSLDSMLDRFEVGSRQSFLYDLEKLVFASSDRKIKVVVGSGSANLCYASSPLLRVTHSEPSSEWAIFEIFDPFFGSLKYTSVCPAHLEHLFNGDVDLMAEEGEVLLGLG
jgi:predicted nucleotide-binding protein